MKTEPVEESLGRGTIRVVEAGGQADLWDGFVASSDHAAFAHQSGWRALLKDVLGHESLYLAAIDETGRWRGILPLVRIRTILGHHLISVPFLNDGGPLGGKAAQAVLVEHAVQAARQSGATLVELRSRLQVHGPVTPSRRKIAVHLPLPSSVDRLWKQTFRAKLRSQVRRPAKEGMTARTGIGEIDPFYRVFSRNMRDLGTPVMPKDFFERISSTFGAKVVFAAVYTRQGVPAAAACCLVWRNEIEVTWASSLRKLNHLSPNMLLYSHLMEEAIRRNLTLFNFGRSTPGSPTHRFKQQWGGEDIDLSWPSWHSESAEAVTAADRPALRIASAMWRHLPLPMANLLGPHFARLLP